MKKEVSNKKKSPDKKLVILFLVGLAVLLAVIATVVHFTTKVTDDSYKDCAIGDVDGNGYINAGDYLLIQKHIDGTAELFESQQKNGDVNLDGKLDKLDMELIQKYATGYIKKLPYTSENETTQQKNETAVTYEDEKVESNVQIENRWSNGDGTYSYQIKVSISNIDDSRYKNWETKIKLSEKAKISKGWDCESEMQDDMLIITGDSIPAGETMGCGVIVTAPENMKILSIVTEK